MLTFIFEIQGSDNALRLEQRFKKCRPQLFKAENGIVEIIFYNEFENLKKIWSAVWALTYEHWFAENVTGWILKTENCTEDILLYCKEKRKGLFSPD